MFNLEGKTAIITGGGQEIGRSIALGMAEHGVNTNIFDINYENAIETVELIRKNHNVRAEAYKVDVSIENDVENGIEAVFNSRGKIDFLVNNAGIAGPSKKIEELSIEEWNNVLTINLAGVFLCCKHIIPIMRSQGKGTIVNMSSVTGKRPLRLRSPYAASKIGVIGFTRTLAAEVGEWNIRANSVCPAGVKGTRQDFVYKSIADDIGESVEEVRLKRMQMSPLKRFVNQSDIADMVAFLCSDYSQSVTGQDFNISTGTVMY